MVVPANNMRYSHRGVVNNNNKIISRMPVSSEDYKILDVVAFEKSHHP